MTSVSCVVSFLAELNQIVVASLIVSKLEPYNENFHGNQNKSSIYFTKIDVTCDVWLVVWKEFIRVAAV